MVNPVGPAPVESREWRQGDVFRLDSLLIAGADGQPEACACPDGVAVVSQSCDAAQVSRPMLQLAPVTRLGETEAREARAGRRPRYAPIPDLAPDAFVDLDFVVTVAKASLGRTERSRGVTADEDVRGLAGAIRRKFGRFAFPDPVAECMEPLRKSLASKATNQRSPLGRVLAEVYAIRVEATNGWASEPYDVQLVVILKPGALPLVDEMPAEPGGLRVRCSDADGRFSQARIADLIATSNVQDEVYWAWYFLAEAWSDQCNSLAEKTDRGDVVSFTSEVVAVDEFPLSRVDTSEALDLEYVSEPLPRTA